MRQCMGCNEHKPKAELIRVVRDPDGQISLDFKGKKSGRGAYLCHSAACLKKAQKTKRLSRALECDVPDEVMAQMEAELDAAR